MTSVHRVSIDEVAVAAGTTQGTVERLVALGIVAPEGGTFRASDIRRVRLVLALHTSGVAFESIGAAIAEGRLSLDFVDELAPEPIPLLPETQSELVERLAMSPELARRLTTIFGTSALPAGEQVRADHAELFELVSAVKEEGAPDELAIRAVRATVDGVRRIVAAQRDFVDTVVMAPLAEAGMSPQQILAASAGPRGRYRELGRRLANVLLERFVDEAIFQQVVLTLEATLAADRQATADGSGAIAFMDVSGYTRLAEEAGDEEAATQAARFIEAVEDVAGESGGRLVKLLGDGVMLHFDDADGAVRGGLALVDRLRGADLPAGRVGINAGPMVRRDGDYFGAVINIAARTAEYARPCEVLVTDEVVDAWRGGKGVHFRGIGRVKLKNVRHPIELYQALPPV